MDQPTYRVGGEVEAWCGPCKGLHDHVIVAVVDGLPKQVLCRSCGGRHNYRTDPARGGTPKAKAAAAARRPVDPEQKKRADAQRTLERELADAVDVQLFDPRGRYRSGQIIEHPSLGRGRVENFLRGGVL